MSAGDTGRAVARGLGELLITAGLVVLLFVVYQLYWTNVVARQAQGEVADEIRDAWQRPPTRSAGTAGGTDLTAVDFGEGFAFLRIPRLGRDWTVPVVQGVGLDDLARGVGHYPTSAGPGEVGNFAVAGHRATNGEPFAYLDQLRKGDVVVAETRSRWYTYVVDSTRIVRPTDTWVIDPVPGRPGARPTERLLTLTTCNPRWASTERLIVFGHLRGSTPKSDGPPAVLAKES
jgi:sortase A